MCFQDWTIQFKLQGQDSGLKVVSSSKDHCEILGQHPSGYLYLREDEDIHLVKHTV